MNSGHCTVNDPRERAREPCSMLLKQRGNITLYNKTLTGSPHVIGMDNYIIEIIRQRLFCWIAIYYFCRSDSVIKIYDLRLYYNHLYERGIYMIQWSG